MNRNAVPVELLAEAPLLVPDAVALSAAIARAEGVLTAVLQATSPATVRVVDVSGRIVRTNEPSVAGHGATLPATVSALWERDQPQRAQDTSRLAFRDMPAMRALGGVTTRQERLLIPSAGPNEAVEIECNAVPVLDDEGKVVGAVTVDHVVAPVTALIHDVNNALNTIMAAAFLAQRRADSPDAIREYAGRITQAAESGAKAAALVERMVREASNSAPAARGHEQVMKSVPAEGSTKAGPLDILLVEDNPDGREFIGRLLRTAGHRVDAVATAAEARTRLDQKSSGVVDLLLTDLDLPDGNGWELAAYARRQRASLRIGVISGWDVYIGSEEAANAEFVLRKPLRAAVLLDHVAGRPTRALPE